LHEELALFKPGSLAGYVLDSFASLIEKEICCGQPKATTGDRAQKQGGRASLAASREKNHAETTEYLEVDFARGDRFELVRTTGRRAGWRRFVVRKKRELIH